MYRWWMNASEIRKEKNGKEEKRERASLGPHQSVKDTCPARVSLAPTQQPFSPSEVLQMDPQKKNPKKANRGSFLFDFRIPGRKEEGASWSWCPTNACSFPGGASSC